MGTARKLVSTAVAGLTQYASCIREVRRLCKRTRAMANPTSKEVLRTAITWEPDFLHLTKT